MCSLWKALRSQTINRSLDLWSWVSRFCLRFEMCATFFQSSTLASFIISLNLRTTDVLERFNDLRPLVESLEVSRLMVLLPSHEDA